MTATNPNSRPTPAAPDCGSMPETRVWKGDRRLTLGDVAVGDLLLFNTTGERPDQPATCTDVWVGVDTHKRITERQAKKAPHDAEKGRLKVSPRNRVVSWPPSFPSIEQEMADVAVPHDVAFAFDA